MFHLIHNYRLTLEQSDRCIAPKRGVIHQQDRYSTIVLYEILHLYSVKLYGLGHKKLMTDILEQMKK